jgi:response regulator of citrate/malate metabolism
MDDNFKDRLTRMLGLDRDSALAAQKQDEQDQLDEENRKKIKQAALQHLMDNTNPQQLQNVSNSFKGQK